MSKGINWTNHSGGLLGTIGKRTVFTIYPAVDTSDHEHPWRLLSGLPEAGVSEAKDVQEAKQLATEQLGAFLNDVGAVPWLDHQMRVIEEEKRCDVLAAMVDRMKEDHQTLRRILGIEALENQIEKIYERLNEES